MDIQALRALFPIIQQAVYLNNAAEAPLDERSRLRLEKYLHLASQAPQDKPSAGRIRHTVRARLVELFGGTAAEYALVTSTGVGIGLAAAGYAWGKDDNVVVPVDEHWNNTYPWLALKRRGVDVRFVPIGTDNRITCEQVARFVDHNTRMVALAAVRFNSGYRADLKAISDIAHTHGALFLVDGIQAAGVVPLNVEADGIDILSCGGFKWLLGLPGTGFLYVRSSVQERITPVLPGMFAAEDDLRSLKYLPDARRYETGSLAYALFHAWTAGLELLQEVGIDNIHNRVLYLTDRLISGLRAKQMHIISPIASVTERSAIVVFSAGCEATNQALYQRLSESKIVVSLRGGLIRVSPAFYNTEAEIDALMQALS